MSDEVKRPNVLVIMTDQQRYDSVSATGESEIETPNIDRLAAEGTLFTNAYCAAPECVPSRHAFISGQHPLRSGCLSNVCGRLDPAVPTLMKSFKEAGFRTAGMGKMHFVPTREQFGFDEMQLSEEVPLKGQDEYLAFLQREGYTDYIYEPQGVRGPLYYLPQPSPLPKEKHSSWWTVDRSIEFIEECRFGEEPFFLFSSFIQPHPPFDPPTPYQYRYLPNDFKTPKGGNNAGNMNYWQLLQNRYKGYIENPYLLRTIKAYYHACVSFVDEMVGRLLDHLEQSGLAENTIVLFLSDHGEFLGDHSCFGKRSWYKEAAQVPLILHLPKTVRSALRLDSVSRCNNLVTQHDLYPTLCRAAGLPLPAGVDGLDLIAQLQGVAKPRKELIGVLDFGPESGSLHSCITDTWKYTYSSLDGHEQIISRSADPDESQLLTGPEAATIRTQALKAIGENHRECGVGERYFKGTQLRRDPSNKVRRLRELIEADDDCSDTARYYHFSDWNGLSRKIAGRVDPEYPLF